MLINNVHFIANQDTELQTVLKTYIIPQFFQIFRERAHQI